MRDQLTQYVELLFAGAEDSDDIRQEILQNTLDRYDDLIAQGKSPEAAYRLAIGGIGDVNEILGGYKEYVPPVVHHPSNENAAAQENRKKMHAVAIAMYILCVVPVIIFSELGLEMLGVVMMFLMIAAATALIIMAKKDEPDDEDDDDRKVPLSPEEELRETVRSTIGTVTLVLYLILSFVTGAWFITWLIFPISGAVKRLVIAFMDLKTSKRNAIARIILNIVVILLLLGILAVALGLNVFSFIQEEHDDVTVIDEASVDADEVHKLNIEWATGTITILEGDTDEILFSESCGDSDATPMVYELQNGELTIYYSKPAIQLGFTATAHKDLTITVPEDWTCGTLNIESASTDIVIYDLTIDTLELDCASSECTLTDCIVKDIDLDAASCDLYFTGEFHTLECDGAATSIDAVCTSVPQSINLDGASAELDLTLPEDCGFRVEMDGVSCDFDSDFDYHHNDGCNTYGDEACHISVDGMSASVYIRNGGHHHTEDCDSDSSNCPDHQPSGSHHK